MPIPCLRETKFNATTSTTVEVKGPGPMAKELTVGEVAARSGVAVSALHFYERKGLIRSHRTGGKPAPI